MLASLCLSLVLAGLPQVTGAAQSPRTPPRDAATTDKKGTAIIKGKVTAADTGRPLRRVRISVSGPEFSEARSVTTAARWREGSRRVRTTRPDQSGLFELRLVPAGEYLVCAVGYVKDGAWKDAEFLKSLVDRATK
jgi:hypothetical protein